jgi:hypothetical protein
MAIAINPTAMLLNPLNDTTHPYRARCPGHCRHFPFYCNTKHIHTILNVMSYNRSSQTLYLPTYIVEVSITHI